MYGATTRRGWLLGVFAVFVATICGAQRPANNNLMFAEAQLCDAPKEVRSWLSFGMHDFDSDGYSDELYAHDEGLVIVWGGALGIAKTGKARSTFVDQGTPMHVLLPPVTSKESAAHNPWDYKGEDVARGLPQFWVEWGGPNRMVGFILDGREIKKHKEILLGPEAAVDATSGGLVYGPDENGKLMLNEFGVLRVLTRNCPPLSKLRYLDLDADGHRDLLIHTKGGDVGVAFGHKGQLKGLHWLEHTSGTAHMVLTGNLDGTYSWVGHDVTNHQAVAWRFSNGEWLLQTFEAPELFDGMTRLHAFPLWDRKWLWLSEHFRDRCMVGAVVEGMEVLSTFRIEDTEFVGAPQLVDGNGDGTLDLVYANAKSNQLVLHNGLNLNENDDKARLTSSHELLFWSPRRVSTDLLWPFFRPHPSQCFEAFMTTASPEVEFQHFRCEMGQLFARGATTLLTAWPTQDWHGEGEAPIDSGRFGISIPHFRVVENQPVGIPPEEWSHVLFSKSKSGRSTLYVNGEKASEGWLREEVDALRIFFLGCSNLGARFRFFHGAIDEVAIWNRSLTPAEAKEAFDAKRVLMDSRPQLYFDFESSASNAFRWGSHALDFENGEGEVVTGVHGQAMLFDGKQTYASLFTDIPDGDLSISIWVKPFESSDAPRQTFLGIYGDWNLDFDLLGAGEWNRWDRSRDLHMHAERIDIPENGFPFRHGEEEYYLAEDGLVYIRAGLDWNAVQTNGADPLSESAGLRGTPWIAGGRLNAVFGNCHIWFQFDPESMTWTTTGRLNPIIKGFNYAIAGLGGTVFIRTEPNPGAWWKPEAEKILYPLSPSAFEGESVGILADWTGFWWVNEEGDLDRPHLLPQAEPIPIMKPELPIWVFMAGGASFFLLLMGRYISRERLKAAIESDPNLPDSAAELALGSALEIYKDLLFRLSEDAGEGVDTHNLDVIFDIHHIETDETRRSRRSRLVKELNDWYEVEAGRQLIRREIDPEDRRRRIYVVDEGLGELLAREFPANGDQA